jgi:hypothetical protein
MSPSEWTHGVRRDESSLLPLRRSSSGAFCILLRSEDVVGALDERPRGCRGGAASKAMDMGWPGLQVRFVARCACGSRVDAPFARIPSNCFLARVASATVSKETIAVPEERPLRSYLRAQASTCHLGCSGRARRVGSYPDLWLAYERTNLSEDGLEKRESAPGLITRTRVDSLALCSKFLRS